jgi:hypothetical protein
MRSACALDPLVSHLDIGALHRGPRDPMRGLLLPWIAGMGRKGVVEGFPIDVLGMQRQMARDRGRQIVIGTVRHGLLLAGQAVVGCVSEPSARRLRFSLICIKKADWRARRCKAAVGAAIL